MALQLKINGTEAVCSIPGDLVKSSVLTLQKEMTAMMGELGDWALMNMDISQVKEIDTVGLAFLIAVHKKTHSLGRDFVLSGCQADVMKLMNTINLSEHFKIQGG